MNKNRIARALIAMTNGEFTTVELVNEAEKRKIKIERKTINNAITGFSDFFDKKALNGKGAIKKFKALPTFFAYFKDEMASYISLLPDCKDVITRNFNINHQTISPDKYTPKEIYSAVLTAFGNPMSASMIQDIARSYGHNVRLDTVGYFLRTQQGKLTKKVSLSGHQPKYVVTEKFLEMVKMEKGYRVFFDIMPDKKEEIKKRLGLSSDIETDSEIASETTKEVVKEVVKERTNRIMPRHMYLAILAAYEKPQSSITIVNIAKKYGYELNTATIGLFFRKHPEFVKLEYRSSGQHFYSVTPKFISMHQHLLPKLISALPEKEEILKKRFNTVETSDETQAIKTDSQENVFLNVTPEENNDIIDNHELSQQEVDTEYVDVANVGRAIVSYIQSLKDRKPVNSEALEELKSKYRDSQQTVINQKNEIQNLNYQLDKLRKMSDENNRKIIDLTSEISKYRNQMIPEVQGEPGKFKMSDVARITTLIKGQRRN